jgi:hypothetical protein
MARPANIVRPTSLHIAVPEDIRGHLDKHLWDAARNRVPPGAYSDFIVALIRNFFRTANAHD